MKKAIKISVKVIGIAIAGVLALLLLVWGGLNILKYAIYSDYYSREISLCENPGLNDGFVCQGICISEEDERILVCGYMTDKSASRIYVTDLEGNSYYVSLSRDGKAYTGHAGGIALSGDTLLISNGGRLFDLSLSSVLEAEAGDTVDIGGGVEVNNSASFVFANEEYVYVGEFHDGGKYVKEHPYETPDGLYHAILTRYKASDLTAPDRVYSIRDKVQGVCVTPEGKIILSTSYGLTSTEYFVYDESRSIPTEHMLDGAPVYYLNGVEYQMSGPAMGEDMDYYDGMAITLTESASDKYIFGKFFFANQLVGLDFGSDKD